MRYVVLALCLVGLLAGPAQAHQGAPYTHKQIYANTHHGSSGGGVHPMKRKSGNCYRDNLKNAEVLGIGSRPVEAYIGITVSWCFSSGHITYYRPSDAHWEVWWGHWSFEGYEDRFTGSKTPQKYRYHRACATFAQNILTYHLTQHPCISVTVQTDQHPTWKLWWK